MLLITLLSSCQHSQTPGTPSANLKKDTLTIRGTLTKLDNSPFKKDLLMLSREENGRYGMRINLSSGRILNPNATIDTDGSFALYVPHTYLVDTTGKAPQFAFIYNLGGATLRDSAGRMITFAFHDINPAGDMLDINKLFGKIVVRE